MVKMIQEWQPIVIGGKIVGYISGGVTNK